MLFLQQRECRTTFYRQINELISDIFVHAKSWNLGNTNLFTKKCSNSKIPTWSRMVIWLLGLAPINVLEASADWESQGLISLEHLRQKTHRIPALHRNVREVMTCKRGDFGVELNGVGRKLEESVTGLCLTCCKAERIDAGRCAFDHLAEATQKEKAGYSLCQV